MRISGAVGPPLGWPDQRTVLRKLADAAGIPIEELVAGPKRAGKAKK
jgi:hypothetical protein